MSEKRYAHLVQWFNETPWAILDSTLAVLKAIRDERMAGYRPTPEEIQARIGAGPSRRSPDRAGTIAVLPIYGVIVPRADLFTQMSGGTSIESFRIAFRDAISDSDVEGILLDVNSPGGSTDLVAEMAAEIRAGRSRKPILASANTRMASAAYWLASQADEIYVTPSGDVGSIGVIAAHEDISGMEEKLGVKTTLISAGKFKTEVNPYEPLTDSAKSYIQARVDEMYAIFTGDVAKGRRVAVSDVRDGYGEGRLLSAKQALKAGMVDGVETIDQTLARMKGQPVVVEEATEEAELGDVLDDEAAADEPTTQAEEPEEPETPDEESETAASDALTEDDEADFAALRFALGK